jgi:hypothetical protein
MSEKHAEPLVPLNPSFNPSSTTRSTSEIRPPLLEKRSPFPETFLYPPSSPSPSTHSHPQQNERFE